MRGIPWRTVAMVLIGSVLLAVAIIPDPEIQNISSLTTDELIATFETSREDLRRAAADQLVARAKTVIPQIESAIVQTKSNVKSQLFDVLEELMLSADLQVADEAESALDRLMMSMDSQVSDGALQVIYSNATLRHARAMSQYLELGGKFAKDRSLNWPMSLHEANSSPHLTARILILDQNWKGQDAGLRFINRLFPGEPLAIHISNEAQVTAAGVQQLRNERGYLAIRREQESCLGIIVDELDEANELRISDVVRESPAALAGLRAGDRIYQFEQQPIHSLHDLREQSRIYPPGTIVELRLHRRRQELRVKLILGSDFATGECLCPG